MNDGTAGFQDLQSSLFPSQAYRFLNEHLHKFGTGSWHHFRTHDLIALSTEISANREKGLTPFSFSKEG